MVQKNSGWNNKITPIILLAFILVISVVLRLIKLDTAPPELFGDELDVGYQAFSILKTGKDLQGNFLPIYIQSLAESRAPLFIYSAVPFIAVFGLNEWGVRLTAAFWGILGIVALYFLTKKLFNSEILSLISCFLLAISPWHLQYSRAGFEVTLLLFLLLTGTWLFLKGLEKAKFFLLTAILFALTPYTYSTAVVFMPLLLAALVVIYRNQFKKHLKSFYFKSSITIFVLILIPLTWQVLFGEAAQRFGLINIFAHPQIIKEIVEARSIDQGGAIFHNKALSFLYEFGRNYLSAFSPQFLFTDGDTTGRHSVGGMGELFWFQLPLLLVFLYFLLQRKINLEKKSLAVILVWLALAPIPSSLTYQGANNATRLILMLPPLTIISGLSFWLVFQNLKFANATKYLVILILSAVAVVNFATYLHRYYIHYPVENWRAWQIGYREAFSYIRQNHEKYKTVIINNTYEPALIRFLFYMQYDPRQFHQKFTGDVPKTEIVRGIDGFTLDKFIFGTLSGRASGLGAIATVINQETLYLASAEDEIGEKVYLGVESERGVKFLKTVTNYLNQPVFYLLTK